MLTGLQLSAFPAQPQQAHSQLCPHHRPGRLLWPVTSP
ncbi:hypothetical protein CMEL01_11879 [Colletotrichum melonis]|uniref:Uncharacterized protein n=1 Tax=Colletotrichum melonis TaxID=1209925 RepID=A0AAI9UZI5_9PEZI|nr:hypothetical protein CMEL01_11879 [Colletotrichum melonis]